MIQALRACLLSALLALPLLAQAQQPSVLYISIDGLKPEAVLDAEAHRVKVPNLRKMMADGVYADSVRGVLPTLTYPSHTSLITGAAPARHGVHSNTTFDPFNKNDQGWYWYYEDIKTPTLFDAARAAHLSTANVYWPVTVGAPIDYNLSQIWRKGTEDDRKLQRAVSTPGLEAELAAKTGVVYPKGDDETVDFDAIRTDYAVALLAARKPAFMTVYLTALDTEQHASGPLSEPARRVLERIDGMIGRLRQAAEAANPGRAYVCVVSDHGFAAVQHDVNLFIPFLQAGLITLSDNNRDVASWRAAPWSAGGDAAIMINGDDKQAEEKTAELLRKLADDPASGVERILTREELQRRGGFPEATFYVSLKIGYELGYKFTGPLVSEPTRGGMHGYLVDHREMLSSFFLVGPGVARNRSVGDIDMRSIAPTLAELLHVKLAAAEQPPLDVK